MIDRWFKRWRATGPSLPPVTTATSPDPHVVPPASPPQPLRSLEAHDGLIWVDSAGKLQIRNPRGRHGHYPVVVVPDWDWLRVSVNGSRVVGEHVLEENTRVHVRLLVQAPQSRLTITVSPDGMEAVLNVAYVVGERRTLVPSTPSPRLTLEPRRIVVEPPPVTLAQVHTDLARAGITAGIVDAATIEAFLARHESGALVVARGVAPQPGGGTLESFRPEGLEGPWRVVTGETIGRRRPAPARAGQTVRGEALPAPMIQPGHEVRLGPGVTVMTHGTHLVATRPGVVIFDAHVVDVVAQHEMAAIGAASDVLAVDGDLVVRGTIQGRTVVVSGNLTVHGDLRNAEVVVGGGITVAGTTAESRVTVGLERYVRDGIRHHTTRVVDGLYDLELTVDELRSLGPRLGEVLARVVADKFTDVLESLAWLQTASRWPGLRWTGPLVDLAAEIQHHLMAGEELDHVLGHLWSLRTELEMCDPVVDAVPMGRIPHATGFSTVENSSIDATGTLTVDSARSSRLAAASVIATRAVVGGFVSATERVQCETLGVVEGTETSIEIASADGVVEADSAYPGVLVVIGGLRHTLRTPHRPLHLTYATLKGGDHV
ncbi:FapA family protein [Sulfobacillus harzensis]|uniref:DUF342 domain-containing protein n=1 Tax=Sulfobacillus harzensis TaxID=2729629 RepID=A0A7Y0L8G0_9FIRM|nr:FapA family protein [Sulfobacillus harzensis]NMP24390.1 DUF342 domain-containing protein [Sulfobacillus harzensis]